MIAKQNRCSVPGLMAACLALALAAVLPLLTAPTASADNAAAVTGQTFRTQLTPPDESGDASALTWSDDSSNLVIDQTPSAANWSLDPGADGSFLIRNEKDGNCIDFTDSDTYNLGPAPCDSGSEQQRWYLELTYGTTTLIRNAATDECLDVSGEDNADGSEVIAYSCNNAAANQNWSPGQWNAAMGDLLTQYSLKRCAAGDTALTCTYAQESDSHAALGPEKCVSTLYDNTEGSKGATPTVAFADTTGWSNTVGGSVTVSAEFGIEKFIISKVTTAVSVNYSHQWIGQKTTTQTYPYTVQKGEWGWLTRAQLMKTVTGTWTFSNGDETWSGEGTSTIPAMDGTDGEQSVVKPHSSPTPPTNCPRD
ncbi:RICIN domain-containing protein [Streptomyces cucumeris]|uniref:RICIN domain-containing protein n=1 Tax=Streptomyces cucumeris TaxID=2962890 RepID=UPI003D71A417